MEAEESRDGLAKAMYTSLFDWIVRKLNLSTNPSKINEESKPKKKGAPQTLFIGILDIFGFEIFTINSFE